MRYLPDGKQMKEGDLYTINELGIPSLVLMERAALKIADTMEERGFDTSCALIVCGSGNNGGDGFALARLLAERGRHVEVLFAGQERSLTAECALQKQIAEKFGIPVLTAFPERAYTVIVDALFGVGLAREVTGSYLETIQWMNRRGGGKVAVDIPSGVCSATGRVLGDAFHAHLTVAMACEKIGCSLYPGKEYAGETVAVPIGIPSDVFLDNPRVAFTYDRQELGTLLPARRENTNKGDYGKLLVIGGSKGMAGAAYLAASAAYAAGAGLVRIYTHEDNRIPLQSLLPEAIVTCYHDYDEEEILGLLDWADAVCIGCGLGTSALSAQILAAVLRSCDLPCIVDADGINLLARDHDLLSETRCQVVLTPHVLEMSRLSGRTVADIKADLVGSAVTFAEEYSVACAVKDSRTAVAVRGRQPYLNLSGSCAMAKAGSGDVLAGVIGAFLAQGMTPFDSAARGVFLHGCAGQEAAARKGVHSSVARDLIRGIGEAMRKAEENRKEQ